MINRRNPIYGTLNAEIPIEAGYIYLKFEVVGVPLEFIATLAAIPAMSCRSTVVEGLPLTELSFNAIRLKSMLALMPPDATSSRSKNKNKFQSENQRKNRRTFINIYP